MKTKNSILIHLFIAVVLSLVINFSYLLLPIITDRGMAQHNVSAAAQNEHSSGVLHLSDDMHGYIICDCERADSIYVTSWQVRTHKLMEGDRLSFSTREVGEDDMAKRAHPRLDRVYMRNGEKFDIDTIYDRPSRVVEFLWQIIYYALVSFLMLVILTRAPRNDEYTNKIIINRILLVVLISVVGIFFAPVVAFKEGIMRIVFFFQSGPRDATYLIVLTKCLFMLAVSLLYTRLYMLMRQREKIVVENERLKTENLATRYNMLMGQINPHFFFNSLNSLSMLVREQDNDRALEYIDQLSYTFRYIIQNGQSGVTTLREEMEFAEAYAYLFKIRYEDKLFFDIDIDEKYMDWTLPALSLQPLIGNAVKHNTITSKNPLHVIIRVKDGVLEVENKKSQKLDVEPSTGIGLYNLRSRWQIASGRDIEVIDEAERFLVRLPLEKQH
ncbi:MAG: histidine kinase [Alistipes sp.]|nr:histidine kinase [Alistipes sp.]MBO7236160.1 histidine kinase [Alistipes sp.]